MKKRDTTFRNKKMEAILEVTTFFIANAIL